jgi:hypothetical protein
MVKVYLKLRAYLVNKTKEVLLLLVECPCVAPGLIQMLTHNRSLDIIITIIKLCH